MIYPVAVDLSCASLLMSLTLLESANHTIMYLCRSRTTTTSPIDSCTLTADDGATMMRRV